MISMVNKIVGQRIKSLRNEYGITQDLLATGIFLTNDVRVSKGMISNWESGRYEPSLYYVQEIARYFGVSLDYLIGLTDEKEPFRDTSADYSDRSARLVAKRLTDPRLTDALEKYFELTEEQKKYVLDMINSLHKKTEKDN